MAAEREENPLVALGVTGCIGAYKAAELLRRLQDFDIEVQPILTNAAQRFITPLTLQTLAGRRTITGLFDEPEGWEVEHISLSDQMAALVVAPATADIIAKFASGLADDFLSTLYLACDKPVIVAPAMNSRMWSHPATRSNVEILAGRGVRFVSPGAGYLACGWEGEGRLAPIPDIVDAVRYCIGGSGALKGRKILITAGPTAEDIDPVRYISNRSSGRMAFALARQALARSADVTIIHGPVCVRPPFGAVTVEVRSAQQMQQAVSEKLESEALDALLLAAAVCDFRPASASESKIKRAGKERISLELVANDDIAALAGKRSKRPLLVGFAAESENLKDNALEKLRNKKLDLIVANPIGGERDVIGSNETEGLIIGSAEEVTEVPRCTKDQMAARILDALEARLAQ